MKDYFDFLSHLIDDGVAAAKKDYADKRLKNRLEGALFGFASCRDKEPHELLRIYLESKPYVSMAKNYVGTAEYWWLFCYQMEIEYIMDVVSAVLVNEGQLPILPHLPSVRGFMKAASILNIQQ